MDQKKIGAFLKALRTEKGLTQEQLAREMLVSSRTVSRWETGSNLPDLSVLLNLADFYGVGLREILDGERKPDAPGQAGDPETRATLWMAAGYTEEINRRIARNVHWSAWLGVAALGIYMGLEELGLGDTGWPAAAGGFVLGLAWGILLTFALLTGPAGKQLFRVKQRVLSRILKKKGAGRADAGGAEGLEPASGVKPEAGRGFRG